MDKGFAPDKRFPQADREAWITLGLYGAYFVWWYACAYGLGGGDPDTYAYVLGFPAWFFYSCILGYPLLTLLLWAVVRLCFKPLPLDPAGEEGPEAPDRPGGPEAPAAGRHPAGGPR